MKANVYSARYLAAKAEKQGHFLPNSPSKAPAIISDLASLFSTLLASQLSLSPRQFARFEIA
ncbi:MAG: hypothetical protein DSM106950_06945 [Stigonema ocellatum SAG 48.90 = DSM 106950]|nr:hypothetical protein [Stigonema ocellatum SAG 48.90 = DSM 106950]